MSRVRICGIRYTALTAAEITDHKPDLLKPDDCFNVTAIG